MDWHRLRDHGTATRARHWSGVALCPGTARPVRLAPFHSPSVGFRQKLTKPTEPGLVLLFLSPGPHSVCRPLQSVSGIAATARLASVVRMPKKTPDSVRMHADGSICPEGTR